MEGDLDAAATELNQQARCFAAFTGVVKPGPRDRFVIVMGMTGSGKSTLISSCTGTDVGIGHGLRSCKIARLPT